MRLARTFDAMGVKRGTRVALLMRNCHRFVEILFSLCSLGAVLVPLNWRLTPPELLYVVKDSDSMVLVYGGEFEETARTLQAGLDAGVTALDAAQLEDGATGESVGEAARRAPVCDSDVAVQMYTAAFGGRPRGAQITHGGYVASAANLAMALSLTDADCSLVVLPLFHTFALEVTVATLARAGKCVLAEQFETERAAESIEAERVSILPCAGQQLAELARELERRPRDTSSLRVVMGSAASPDLRKALRVGAPEARFVDSVYGQTECGTMVTGCDSEEAEAVGGRCAGRATMYTDVSILGEDDTELPRGVAGEIAVRGPRVMLGYYKEERLNEEALRGGWLHTGDLGILDQNGYLHYVGRKNELIKSGMENVYPAEVESVLAMHPAVKEVAVIGVPDEQWGEAVTAIVALKSEASATAGELAEFCKDRMAGYKKPKRVHLVDELPRDRTGRIARAELMARYGGSA